MELTDKERAFVIASVQLRIESEQKAAKEIKAKR